MQIFRDGTRPLAALFRRALHQRSVPPAMQMCMECMGGGEINGVVCRGCDGERHVEAGQQRGQQRGPVS